MSPRRLIQALVSGWVVAYACLSVGSLAQADPADGGGGDPSRIDDASSVDDAEPEEEAAAPRASKPLPPVGTRFAETLEGRKLRIGYSWERHKSQGLISGTGNDKPPSFWRNAAGDPYASTLRSLEVTIHTVELAYAPHPRVALVAEVPFVQKEIERVDTATGGPCNGVRCEYQTEGVGDVRFAMVVPFIRKQYESSQIHIGLDVPTGSIRRQGGTALRLPYLAQIGNGTVDFEWGWTYNGAYRRFAWGGQALGRHPLGRNGLDYREGSQFTGRVWGVFRLFGGIDVSLRADWEKQNEIEGFDRDLRPLVDPAEDAEKYERITVSLAPGLSLEVPSLSGQRVGVEFGVPVYQEVDGPQLERDWSIKTAWRWIY